MAPGKYDPAPRWPLFFLILGIWFVIALAAMTARAASPCLVAVGDSITLGNGFESFVLLPGWDVVNLGKGGTTSIGWSSYWGRQQYDLVDCDPMFVHVMLGGNDASPLFGAPATTPAVYRENLMRIVGDLEDRWPTATIMISQPTPLFGFQSTVDRSLSLYRLEVLSVVDETSAVFGIDGLHAPLYATHFPDSVHLSQSGHDVLRSALILRVFLIRMGLAGSPPLGRVASLV